MSATLAILLVSRRDRTGIVATLSDFIHRHAGNIEDADQHSERSTGAFFMRLRFAIDGFERDRDGFASEMGELAERFDMGWELHFDDRRPRKERGVKVIGATAHYVSEELDHAAPPLRIRHHQRCALMVPERLADRTPREPSRWL